MKTILKKDFNYTLVEDNNRYELQVLCGSSAYYELNHILTETELELFKKQGEEFIDELARTVRDKG